MKIYLDENNIVHKDFKEGYTEAEHSFFDTVPEEALSCYKFVPPDFIQCIDSKTESAVTRQHNQFMSALESLKTVLNEQGIRTEDTEEPQEETDAEI